MQTVRVVHCSIAALYMDYALSGQIQTVRVTRWYELRAILSKALFLDQRLDREMDCYFWMGIDACIRSGGA
jgi:hypothetical protein